MNIRDEILDTFGEEADDIMFAEGFDRAIVGVGRTFDGLLCAVYDVDKIIQELMKDGMDYEEAHEYFEFKIACSCVGDQTPIFMHLMSHK